MAIHGRGWRLAFRSGTADCAAALIVALAITWPGATLASMPVPSAQTGCVKDGVFTSDRGYVIAPRWKPGEAAMDLSSYEGQRLRLRGNLLPGDRLILDHPIEAIGRCGPGTAMPEGREATDGWTLYVNARFGTAIRYPGPLFVAEPAPPLDDSRTFRTRDGAAEIIVYAQPAAGTALAARHREDIAAIDAEIKINRLEADGYVIAGTERGDGAKEFIKRLKAAPDGLTVHVVEVRWQPDVASRIRPVATAVADSLAIGSLTPATAQTAKPQTTKPQTTNPEATKPEATTPAAPPSGRRVALLIGNGRYRHAPALPTPANDVAQLAARLDALGFKVITATDRSRPETARLLADFHAATQGADVALFYFSGHGIQVEGRNYLLPVDADFSDASAAFDVEARAMDVAKFIAAAADARVAITLLDACRDNPFGSLGGGPAKSLGGGPTKGLAVIPRENLTRGRFIGFAAEPGRTAETGTGEVSVFTTALLKALAEPGLDISVLFRKVRTEVERTTAGRQSPRYVDDLAEELVLNAGR